MRLLALLLTSVLFTSCGALLRSSYKEKNGAIPPGFGKEDVTILAVRHPSKGIYRRYNKNLEKNLQKHYSGKYKIIDTEDLRTEAYGDVNTYRYILDGEIKEGPITGHAGNMNIHIRPIFSLYDRKSDKEYKTDLATGSYTKVMKAYLKAIEASRIKNSK